MMYHLYIGNTLVNHSVKKYVFIFLKKNCPCKSQDSFIFVSLLLSFPKGVIYDFQICRVVLIGLKPIFLLV